MASNAIQHLLVRVRTFSEEIKRIIDDGSKAESGTLDYFQYRSDMLYHHAIRLSPSIDNHNAHGPISSTDMDVVINKIKEVCMIIRRMSNRVDAPTNYQACTSYTGNPGRPKFNISREQLEYFIENGFNSVEIATMLGVSVRTVRRRMDEFDIVTTRPFSKLSDEELGQLIRDIQKESPRSRYRMMIGYLRAREYRAQQQKVREMMRLEDPQGTIMRWMNTVKRRVYSVSGPNALRHIDGNHKLIRWRMVIHGGIDGYSRIPVFLQCSTNNRASTVLSLFLKAVQQYGLPSRVRSDKGGENVNVSLFMLGHPNRGPGRGSMIVGRSVHNQWIERLWRDLFYQKTATFYQLFHHLEDCGVLDITNELHMFSLQYIFIPRINKQLEEFVNGWISHSLSSANNKTPRQLWISGMQGNAYSDSTVSQEMFGEDFREYGIDWAGPLPNDEYGGPSSTQEETVEVPETTLQLSHEKFLLLQSSVDPLQQSNNYGIDSYLQTVQVVGQLLQE